MDFVYFGTVSIIVLGLIIIIMAITLSSRKRSQSPRRFRSTWKKEYLPGKFGGQMELDLRLPYRRFKQLYPETELTYEEYKTLQMQRAYRRSMSSQDNKRMVR